MTMKMYQYRTLRKMLLLPPLVVFVLLVEPTTSFSGKTEISRSLPSSSSLVTPLASVTSASGSSSSSPRSLPLVSSTSSKPCLGKVDVKKQLQRSWSSSTSSSALFASQFDDVERPDPSTLLSAQNDMIQKFAILLITLFISGGTYVFIELYHFLGQGILPPNVYNLICDTIIPIPMGLLFTLLGVSHFVYTKDYANTVPPIGTWGGLWNVPAPSIVTDKLGLSTEEFHVLWTGVAEVGGGLLLILSALNIIDFIPPSIPGALLFLLTVAVTPSNIYMATHDAQMGFAPPVSYPWGHVSRAVVQCVFLSLFWVVAFH